MPCERVETLLEDIRQLSEERYAIAHTVRELVMSVDPGVSEEVKYGGILFSVGSPFCGVFSYAQHVSLELSEGARLTDPFGVLEGGGKHRRHIKLRAATDITDKHVFEYISAAYAVA
ncbi:DUF1801 domain-containing protein [Halopseudomonas salegens]|uniref:YdhG-like domain-containing protein n=1 Tax=Halopseudomonas salegens TaxID=1434072 RepID=A0A1H2E7S3_9GAMM|nr:DUF1801 domain-containing protein [Halopseudomonas salegens]SDT91123.1 hypothetical protein SAMN05216210_0425 [Halopseudomonas salegens]